MAMTRELIEALQLLQDEVCQLYEWARDSEGGGWSTHQVRPMRARAIYIESVLID